MTDAADSAAPLPPSSSPDPSSAAPPPRRRGRLALWLLPALALLLAIAFYATRARTPAANAGEGRTATAGAPAATGRGAGRGGTPTVAVARAQRGDMPVYVSGLGSVTPFYAVTVKPRVDGQLMRVAVAEGSLVRQNDLVAEIDPRPFDVAVTQMQGQLARDRALLENARRDFARYQSLIGQDAVARQQLDTQASLVAQLEGTVQSDEGQLASAQLQRQYCRVVAPIAGRVGLRIVDPGNIVHAADATGLLVITQVQPIAVLFAVSEDALPAILQRLHGGLPLPVEAFNRDGTRTLSSGRLATSDNQIDPTTGTVRLKALFDNRDGALFPNQFVNARLTVDVRKNVLLVPPAAIRRGAQGSFVYRVESGGVVRVRTVTTGPSQADAASIETGLADGDQVVIDSLDDLRDGSRVQIAPSRPRTPGSAGSAPAPAAAHTPAPTSAVTPAFAPASAPAPATAAQAQAQATMPKTHAP